MRTGTFDVRFYLTEITGSCLIRGPFLKKRREPLHSTVQPPYRGDCFQLRGFEINNDLANPWVENVKRGVTQTHQRYKGKLQRVRRARQCLDAEASVYGDIYFVVGCKRYSHSQPNDVVQYQWLFDRVG